MHRFLVAAVILHIVRVEDLQRTDMLWQHAVCKVHPFDTYLCMVAARMWPYITEAAEKQAKAMLPEMLEQNKPTWMTTLKLHKWVIALAILLIF